MHSSFSILALAGLASTAAAFDAPVLARHFARQTTGGGDAAQGCASTALSIADSLPTPTGDLLSYISDQATMMPTATQSDICATPNIPTSLTSAYSSYQSELLSWYSSGSSEIAALVTSCSNVPGFDQIQQLITAANQATSSCFGGVVSTTSGSASGSQTQSSVATSTITSETVVPTVSGSSTFSVTKPVTITTTGSPAGAPRATAGAVMAAAGVIGAAILL